MPIAAGTDNKPYVDADCLRSRRAHPELLAKTLGTPVDSEACSGATTEDVLKIQLPAADLGPGTQLVTLTVGINNVGWQTLLTECLTDETSQACQAALAQVDLGIAGLPSEITTVLEAIHDKAPRAQVVITGYPEAFGEFSGSCNLGNFGKGQIRIDADQTHPFNALVTLVNMQIGAGVEADNKDAAGRHLATAGIDVNPSFEGHRLCDTGDRWISGLLPENRSAV